MKLTTKLSNGAKADVSPPESLPYRIKLLSLAMLRCFQGVMDPHGLTPSHWSVLCCLWREDGLPTSAISERMQQLGATLTGVLDNMEKRGLLRREREPQDRRVVRVWLTEEGSQLERVLVPHVERLIDDVFGCLSKEEYERLSITIDRLNARLAELPVLA